MSGKRANIFGQGKPERPYEEREDAEADVPQRATAAQMAARKIRTAKPRRTGGGPNTPSSTSLGAGASFGASPQTAGGFGFGAPSPAPAVGGDNNNNTNGGMFGTSSTAFGGTNSFPPTQQPAPTNAFSNGSFPSFGAGSNNGNSTANPSNTISAFQPAPPTAPNFNFSASNSAPTFGAGGSAPAFNAGGSGMFAQNGASQMNGNASQQQQPAGGNLFGTNPTNIFGGLSQNNGNNAASTGANFGGSTATSGPFGNGGSNATSGSFGNGSSNAGSNLFGSINASQNTPAQPSTPFSFGAGSTPAQNTATTSAGGNAFGGFGSGQNTTAPAKNNFGGFGGNAQNGKGQQDTTAPAQTSFGGFGGTAQNGGVSQPGTPFGPGSLAQDTGYATATATPTTQFSFGANSTTTAPPTSNLFGASNAPSFTTAAPASNLFGASSTPFSAPASNSFSGLPTSGAPAPSFPFGQQTPQAASTPANPFAGLKMPEEQAPAPKPALFGSIKAPEQSASTPGEATPQPNLFASLAKPPPSNSPSSGFNFSGAAQQNGSSTRASEKPAEAAEKPNPFAAFSTPQPAKTQDFSKPQQGAFSAQPKQGNGLFAPDRLPPSQSSGNTQKTTSFSGFGSKATPAAEAPKDSTSQPAKDASSPFNSNPTPSTNRPNLFTQSKQQAPASSPAMPSFTGAATSGQTTGPELPKIPKAHVPKEWNAPSASTNQNHDSLYNVITALSMQLQQLNENYRGRLMSLSPTADWSSLSQWHHQRSSAIKTKIDIAKKERAAANGVTGNESSLSTKRKVDDGSPEERQASPTKRARPADPPATPTPQPAAQPPKANPPATATSNLFAKAIGNKPQASSTPSTLFTPKAATVPAPEPAKPAAPAVGFQFTSSKDTSASPGPFSANAFKPTASTSSANGGFKPSTAASSGGFMASTAASIGGFKPSTSTSSGGFASQFAAKAKTYEQLAAERKKKAMDEDYDSDDETKAEWSARYDKQEAERIAKEKEAAAGAKGFSIPLTKSASTKAPEASTPAPKPAAPAASSSTPAPNPFAKLPKSTSSSTPVSNPFSNLAKPASGASTPGLFGSRAASPAPSTGGSLFNAGSAAPSPAGNIFGHLSSASSNKQDESDEEREEVTEASQNEQPAGSTTPPTPPNRKFGASETEADESNDATSRYKKQDTVPKGSLLSRMTRDEGADSEKENSNSGPMFGQTNGTSTPPTKPFKHFDFGAAAGSKSSPLKPGAGDQSYKEGTPIKFGTDVSAEKKATAPSFNFTSATPSTTPSKPPPSYLFGASGSTTPSSSSHLAPTTTFGNLASAPSSVFSSRAATPTDAETSAASAGEDDDESSKHEQVDLSRLTAEERDSFTIVFESDQALAKRQTDNGDGTKKWDSFARGPLYILKDKVTGKCFVRIRIASGATPLNYSILPKLESTVIGASLKMVQATMPKREGGFESVYMMFKTHEEAVDYSQKYNASLPS